MRELYLTLENGRVGIFESPTGTVSIDASPELEKILKLLGEVP